MEHHGRGLARAKGSLGRFTMQVLGLCNPCYWTLRLRGVVMLED